MAVDREQRLARYDELVAACPGRTMREYVRVPDELLEDTEAMVGYLNASYAYVMSLPPK